MLSWYLSNSMARLQEQAVSGYGEYLTNVLNTLSVTTEKRRSSCCEVGREANTLSLQKNQHITKSYTGRRDLNGSCEWYDDSFHDVYQPIILRYAIYCEHLTALLNEPRINEVNKLQ
jgi:hypothetical protein